MPAILAIETATGACSAALSVNERTITRFVIVPEQQQHTDLILSLCQALLSEAGINQKQLSAVAFGEGPGSFTGVRLAAAVTQGIALAHALPVIPVPTLQALAQAAFMRHGVSKVLTGMDARMKEIYWGGYILEDKNKSMQTVISPTVGVAAEVEMPDDNAWFGAGSAWKKDEIALTTRLPGKLAGIDATLLPSAKAVLVLALNDWRSGRVLPPDEAIPNYVRNRVV